MLTIYIGKTPVCFVSVTFPIPHEEGVMYTSFDAPEVMKLFVETVEKSPQIFRLFIRHSDPELALKEFSSLFKVIEAAGGRVRNSKGETLFIFRQGKWDLPKGKIEKGETVEKAAIREVEEECGVSGLRILGELKPTYHTYSQGGDRILKKTFWFEMESDRKEKLIPQSEEGITDARWMNKAAIQEAVKNTFPSIRDVMSEV